MLYQLFHQAPPKDLIIHILQLVGIYYLDDNNSVFTKNDIYTTDENKQKWNIIILKLKDYYLPCKYKYYCNSINAKKIITMVRQCLKVFHYTLEGKEKYSNGKKVIQYRVKNMKNASAMKHKKCTINFD